MTKKIIIAEPEEGLKFIDTHCHLPFPRPQKNDKLPPDELQYKQYLENGGVYLITSSIDNATLKLIQNFIKGKNKIGYTCGWAPQTVTYTPEKKYNEEWKKWIDFVINNSKNFLGIGEIGIDFHHAKTLEKRTKQVLELEKIFELTLDLDKPYILHVRNAAKNELDIENPNHKFNHYDGATKEILRILEEFNIKSSKVMWHCFSGPDEYGLSLSEQGYKLSVPSSAYGNNKWRRVTAKSSLDSLVTETDSYYQHPYLHGPLNVPLNVRYSIAAISYTHNISQVDVSTKTVHNALEFFNLDIET